MALTEIDRSLLKRCLANEPGAWKDFIDRFIGLFVHVIHHSAHARSMRLSNTDVDDLTSEILLALLKDDSAVIRRFRGESSLATYLTVISRRVVVRELVRRRRAESRSQVSAHRVPVDKVPADDREEQRIEDQDEIERMLSDLSDEDAAVVRQFHLEGKSYREISSRLGIPENSIGPTLSRVRKKLKQSNVST